MMLTLHRLQNKGMKRSRRAAGVLAGVGQGCALLVNLNMFNDL